MRSLPPIALLAGGRGTRLGPETAERPKSLVDINGRPFIEYQLTLLRSQGASRLVILAGHFGAQIESAVGDGHDVGLAITYSFDGPAPLGTGGAVQRALPLLGEQFLVLYGDSYLDVDYQEVARNFREARSLGLLTVCEAPPGVAPNVRLDHGRLTAYGKSPPPEGARHIDYGLCAFRANAFGNFPRERAYDLGEVFASLIARDQLQPYQVARPFQEIGSPEGLRAFRERLAQTGSGR
jgi:NDP-sugar pyrophosphorylase family protein